MSIKDLDARVQTIRELQTTIDELTAELEAAKDTIKSEMAERGEETITGNGWRASWKIIEGSRFDSKALKAADPETFARYTIPTRTARFTIN